MLHVIESDALRVAVSNTGAELQSIMSTKTGEEFLWQGDPAWWGSRAPVLFPIIGGLRNGTYDYSNNTYVLAKHGFVRNAYFHREDIPSGTESRIVLEYVDNPSTRRVYPFQFSFKTIFTLSGRTLNVAYRVENQGEGAMFFSVGAHEAFRCPRGRDEAFNDYYLEFDCDGEYQSYPVTIDGLLGNEPYPVIENGRVLPLKHSLFANDALIFKHIAAKKVAIKSLKSNAVVEVAYDSAHLGIWTKVGAPFICIEPWCGLPDNADANGDFTRKKGVLRLEEGGVFTFTHVITIQE